MSGILTALVIVQTRSCSHCEKYFCEFADDARRDALDLAYRTSCAAFDPLLDADLYSKAASA